MGKYVDITFKDKSWIFSGSVKTFECDPTETCGNCGGNGRCPSCNGQGETRCPSCGGRGINRCSRCGGGGIDRDGKRCYMCHGSGTIDCSRCHGKGYIMCNTCWGSGRCMTCGGTGEVTCERCQGTGFYQQYLEYTAYYCVRQLCHPGPTPDLIDGLRVATGEELYKAVCKLWRKEGILAFDDTEKDLKKLCDTANKYETYAEDFKKQYEQTSEMQENIPEYMSYKNTLISSKIPATRIRYEINGKDYEMVLLGDNGVVCYDDLPKSIKVFEMSKADRVKQDRFARHRHKDLAKLTAYIFNLDGISPEESSNLYLIMKHMCLNANQRDRRMRYYSYRYTPKVSHEAMVRKLKHLLVSKKTISYIWQCIAVDREISLNEQAFFNHVIKSCNISESDLSSLKRFSSKFATLESDQFVKEYLDSDPVTLERNLDPLWIGGIAVGAIMVLLGIIYDKGFLGFPGLALSIGSFICYRRIAPPDEEYVEKLYELVSEEPEFDRSYVDGGNIFVRFGYSFVDGLMKIWAKTGIAFDKLMDRIRKPENINVSEGFAIMKDKVAKVVTTSKTKLQNTIEPINTESSTVSEAIIPPAMPVNKVNDKPSIPSQPLVSPTETQPQPAVDKPKQNEKKINEVLPSDNKSKKSKKGLIIGIIVALVLATGGATAYYLLNKMKQERFLAEQKAPYEQQIAEQQRIQTEQKAQYEAELEAQRKAQQSKLYGYEWLKGVWAGVDDYGNFGRMIVSDSYYQVVNSNMDEASDRVEDMPKQDIELKNRPDYITREGNGVSFGFDEYIRVDVEHRSIYIVQGEYSGIALRKIEEDDFEAAVFEANHSYPPQVSSNDNNDFVSQNTFPEMLQQTSLSDLFSKDASSYRFSESDLSPLSAKELTYLRNSVYAKHGYVFKSQELNNYFKQFGWYHPDSSVTEAALNNIEKTNVQFIKNYQEQNGKTYKPQ